MKGFVIPDGIFNQKVIIIEWEGELEGETMLIYIFLEGVGHLFVTRLILDLFYS